jgi:tetratricopeptide (TPR) repeat protein
MRGWALWHRPYSTASSQEAQRTFERALEIDPGSVGAMIGIATILVINVADGLSSSSQQDLARAGQLLAEALERDAHRSIAHYAMGMLRRDQNRLAEARIEFETAIALDRNNNGALRQLGLVSIYLGEPEAGIPYIEKDIRLNPHDPFIANSYWGLGASHLFLGHVDQAIDLLSRPIRNQRG